MNAKASPFLVLLIPFATGIGFGTHLTHWFSLLLSLFVVFFGFLCYLYKRTISYSFRWLFGTGSLFALFLAGACSVIMMDERNDSSHFAKKGIESNCFLAELCDVPSKSNKIKVQVRLVAAGNKPDSMLACKGNALLYFEYDSLSNALNYGDRILVWTNLSPTEGPKNPFAFDYGQYLHYQNIHYTAFVRAGSFCLLSRHHGNWLWDYAYRCRANLLEVLRYYFPTQDEYAVASALLVGYKDDLSEDLRTAYAETGSMHALAVSGTHVGFLYMGLVWLLRRIPVYSYKGKLMEIIVALMAIWIFTFITGATASVLRASVMFSVFLMGQATFRYANVWNIMATSAFILLLINPYYLFDAGFQLSYSAVAGMVFFYPLFYKRSKIRNKLVDMAWQTLLVGFAAQLGTLPLTLYYFHQFPVYFWLAGWIVVFGGAVFLGGGSLLVVLQSFYTWLAWPAALVGKMLFTMLFWMNKIIMAIQQLPGSVVSGIWLAPWAVLLLFVAIALYGAAMLQKSAKHMLFSFSLIVFLLLCSAFRAVEQVNQRQITVYHLGGGKRMIDFFDGAHTFCLSDTLSKKQVMFSAQSNRWANGQLMTTQIFFSGKPLKNEVLLIGLPIIQFYDKKIAFITDQYPDEITNAGPTMVSALILSKDPKLPIADYLKKFTPNQIIADPSNSRKRVEQWKKECDLLQVPFYDIRSQGAWVFRW